MTPDERQFAATRLRELSGQIRDQLGLLDGHIAERELFLKTAETTAVLAEVLAEVVEDEPEAGDDGISVVRADDGNLSIVVNPRQDCICPPGLIGTDLACRVHGIASAR